MIDYKQKIGNHTLGSFCYSSIARKTIVPTEDQIQHLRWLVRDILNKIEERYGQAYITQGIRDMEVHGLLKQRYLQDQKRAAQDRVGFAKPSASSWHLSGDSLDITYYRGSELDEVDNKKLAEIFGWIVANELPMRECRLYNSHIHVARFDRHFMKIKDLTW